MFIYRGNKGKSNHALVQYTIRLEEDENEVLQDIADAGGFENVICLMKSILREVIADDRASRKIKKLDESTKRAKDLHP